MVNIYFNIHLDSHNMVESITYLGKEYIEVENFVFLIGLSHFYLYHVFDKYVSSLLLLFLLFFFFLFRLFCLYFVLLIVQQ